MDLIYMNADKEDIGVLKDYSFDLAFGTDENNFECVVNIDNHKCQEDYFLYIEDTEYGGIIDSIKVDTESRTVTYIGRTWHGILASKIIQPYIGDDYYICNGNVNEVINKVIEDIGLDAIFKTNTTEPGFTVDYQMNRYIDAYKGIKKLLLNYDAKLTFTYKDGYVWLDAVEFTDYSQDEQFDQDQIALTIQKNYNPVNHVICLGQGDLKDRRVIHIYVDAAGNVSGSPSQKFINERVEVYDNSSAESDDDLIDGGVDIIKEAWQQDTIDYGFDNNKTTYDIGDVIGGYERITDTSVRAEISKKIVKISQGNTDISYECKGIVSSISAGPYYASGDGATGSNVISYFDWFTFADTYNGDLYANVRENESSTQFEMDEEGNLYVSANISNAYTFAVDERNDITVTE